MRNTVLLGITAATIVSFYLLDVTLREQLAAKKARKRADQLGKPLLNIGSGTKESCFTGAKLRGDVNCDLGASPTTPCGPKTVCRCNAEDLSQFRDKEFGVALMVNVLGYVPDKKKALAEIHRVADEVIISNNFLPWPQWGPGPLFPTK